MKILLAYSLFAKKWGGVFNVCYHLSKQLSAMGHEVTILTTDFGYDSSIAHTISDVEVIPFHCTANVAGFIYTPSMKSWLNKHIKEYDIVHIHGYRGYQTNIISKYAVKYSIPYIIQPHGSFPRIVEKQNLKMIYDLVWGNKAIRNAAKVVAVSEAELKQIAESGLRYDDIDVIYNGVDVEHYLNANVVKTVVDPDILTILYAGRLHNRKGIDFLIRSFAMLLSSRKDICLRISGTGDEQYVESLLNLSRELGISENVEFLGLVPDLKTEYVNANLLVYPSVHEIFGLVPFEALLCGTPVIVTDDCGCGDIIGGKDMGYLVKYGDIEGLADMISRVFSEYDVALEKTECGKVYIRNELAWDRVVERYVDLYCGVMG